MDLRDLYKRIREIESTIDGDYTVVVSHQTPDGGKAGVAVEAPRFIAARMIAENRARLATPDEIAAHQKTVQLAVEEAEKTALSNRVQVAIVSDADLAGLKQKTKSKES